MKSINSFFSINTQIKIINKKRFQTHNLQIKNDIHWKQIKSKQKKLNIMWYSGNSKLFDFLNEYYVLETSCKDYIHKNKI